MHELEVKVKDAAVSQRPAPEVKKVETKDKEEKKYGQLALQ